MTITFAKILQEMQPAETFYVEKKIKKLDKFLPNKGASATAEISIRKAFGKYNAALHIKSSGINYSAHESAANIRGAVDAACTNIENRLKKGKEKNERKNKRESIRSNSEAISEKEFLFEETGYAEAE